MTFEWNEPQPVEEQLQAQQASVSPEQPQREHEVNDSKEQAGRWGSCSRREVICVALILLLMISMTFTGIFVAVNKSNSAAVSDSTVPVYRLPVKPEPMIITDQEELDMIISELAKNNFLSEKVSIIPETVTALLSANSDHADSFVKAASWVTRIDTMNVKQDVIARFVLATIYFMNGGVSWNNSTNWLSAASYHCDWYGVNCCEELIGSVVCEIDSFGQVTELDLYRNNVHGPIPTSVVLLPYLHAMYLNENSLTGHIPAKELASMLNFGKLFAQYNYLNGTISQDWKESSSIGKRLLVSFHSCCCCVQFM